MADIPDDPFGFMRRLGDEEPKQEQTKLQDLEGIQVPDISAETAPVQGDDRLVKVWKLSTACNLLTMGFVDIKRDLVLVPPGFCCRDMVIEVPLSEAKAKGYHLVNGDEKWAP